MSAEKKNTGFSWRNLLQTLLFAGLGVFLLWLAFRQQNWKELGEHLGRADYFWMGMVLLVALLGHWIRAMRWRLLLQPLGHSPGVFRVFLALMTGYLVNLGVPRLGEITRCGVLSRSDKVPFPALFGSVVAERVIDVVFLLVFAAISFGIQFDRLQAFLSENIWNPLLAFFAEKEGLLAVLLIVLVAGLLLSGILFWIFRAKIMGWLRSKVVQQFKNGLISILLIWKGPEGKKRGFQFILYTLGIWLGYFLMTWLWFFAFEETAGLGMATALFIWSVANLSRTLPIHGGGLGAFHFLVKAAFVLVGVEATLGLTIATLMHTTQTVFYLVVGGIAVLVTAVLQGRIGKAQDSKS